MYKQNTGHGEFVPDVRHSEMMQLSLQVDVTDAYITVGRLPDFIQHLRQELRNDFPASVY